MDVNEDSETGVQPRGEGARKIWLCDEGGLAR